MRNIKEIRAEIATLRAEYEVKEQELRAEIERVRLARGLNVNMYYCNDNFLE